MPTLTAAALAMNLCAAHPACTPEHLSALWLAADPYKPACPFGVGEDYTVTRLWMAAACRMNPAPMAKTSLRLAIFTPFERNTHSVWTAPPAVLGHAPVGWGTGGSSSPSAREKQPLVPSGVDPDLDTPAPIPLPAGLGLLASAWASLWLVRRRAATVQPKGPKT